MRKAEVRAFLDAADDLLAAQQRLMPDPLPEELRSLTMAYLEKRAVLLLCASGKAGRASQRQARSVSR